MSFFRKNSNSRYLKEQRKDVVAFHYVSKSKVKDASYVFIWDLDKTYLDTHFESFSGLMRGIFEKAFQKRNVPGTAELVKALSKQINPLPIYFISASPPQMQEKIKSKLDLDGIQPFGFLSKDNLKNLRPALWKHLTNHIGFKIQALMEIRLLLSKDCKMICWGDDSEADATVYSLFSDICSYRLTDREIRSLLIDFSISVDQIDLIIELRDEKKDFDPLKRVYINLAIDTDPEYYRRYGRRLMAVDNTFEVVLDLFQRGFVSLEGVLDVVKALKENYNFNRHNFERSYELLCVRKRMSNLAGDLIKSALKDLGFMHENYEPTVAPLNLDKIPLKNDFTQIVRPWVSERIDYLSGY